MLIIVHKQALYSDMWEKTETERFRKYMTINILFFIVQNFFNVPVVFTTQS